MSSLFIRSPYSKYGCTATTTR